MNQVFHALRGHWGARFKFVFQTNTRLATEKRELRERKQRWQVAWDKTQSLPPGSVRDEALLAELEAEAEAIKREEEKLAKEEEAFNYMTGNPTLVAETRLVSQALSEKTGGVGCPSPPQHECLSGGASTEEDCHGNQNSLTNAAAALHPQDGSHQGPHLEPVTLIPPSYQDTGSTLRNRRPQSEATLTTFEGS